MRKLNFLRKSERKSVGTTLALTVGSPSVDRRYSALKHLAFMLLFLLGSLNVWGEDATFTPTTCGWTTTGGSQSGTISGVTISTSNGVYNSNNGDFRVYKSAKLTISSSVGNITNIAFTFSGSNNGGWSTSYTPNATSWESPAASGTQARITNLVVTVASSSKPTVSIDPEDGTVFYSETQTITLTGSEGSNVYYTLDGEDPTSTSTKYTEPFTINATKMVKAIAIKDAQSSDVASATITKGEPVDSYNIDFETNAIAAYVNWDFSNIRVHSAAITAHAGTYYGSNANENDNPVGSASITTTEKIEYPGTLTFYISKESNNTTASSWIAQVSSDGSNWTDVETFEAQGMSKGAWNDCVADLSSYSDVYVRIAYSGSNAARAIDDILLTINDAPSCDNKATISAGDTENGSFDLSEDGEQSTCDAAVEVVVTPHPAEHFEVDQVTASNGGSVSGPDSDGKYTVTYAKDYNNSSVIIVTFKQKAQYTVTWNVSGNETIKTSVYKDEKPEFPANPASCDQTSTTFIGWSTAPWEGKSTNLDDKIVYTSANAMPAVTGVVTYYAVFAKVAGESGWIETAIADLGASDIFVIVGDNGSTFAMTNANGTGSAPGASSVTIADSKISGAVADNIKWNISGNATDGYTFYPNGDSEKWLYCTNTNNGVRVGTNENKTFTIVDEYLKHSGTSRYVGIYNSQDWRCYDSYTGTSNIKDQTFKFYKYFAGSASDYMTTCTCADLGTPVVSATEITYNSAKLTWQAVANADKYLVKFNGVDQEPTSNTYFNATGLTASTQYTYQVKALAADAQDEFCDGAFSTEANFSTTALPKAHLTLIDIEGEHASSGDYDILTPFDLPTTAAPCGKAFYGWTATENYTSETVAPEYKAGDEFIFNNQTPVILYAVYANVTGGGTNTTNIAHTSASTTNMSGDNDAATSFGLNADEWSVIGYKGGGSNYPGLNKDGTIRLYYNASGNSYIDITAPTTITSVGVTCKTGNDNIIVKVGDAPIALEDDVYPINAATFRIINGYTESNQVHIQNIAVNFTIPGTYSNYSTTCAAAPEAIVDPEEINATAEAVAGIIEAAYDNVNEGAVSVAIFNDATCTEAFDGGWLTASINDDKNIAYAVAANTTYVAREAYIKLTAPGASVSVDPAVVIIPVSQEGKATVFSSLEDLVAAKLASGTEVTVSFSHVMISDEIAIASSQRKGVYLDVKAANNKDIEIFYAASPYVPSNWVKNGYVSATDLVATWTYYNQYSNDQWELVPANGFSWEDDLTYEEPSESIISVTPAGDVNFGAVVKDAIVEPKTISVTLTNVAAATVTLGGTNHEAFNISKTALVNGDEIEISVASTATLGDYSATITISDDADQADPIVVNLLLSVEEAETPVNTESKWVAATEIADGVQVLIVGEENGTFYAMSEDRGNNRGVVAGTIEEDVFTPGAQTMSFTLVAQEGGTYALRASNGKYLYAGGTGNSNWLNTKAYDGELDANAKWNIDLANSTIIATSSNRNEMRFNKSNSPKIISCYQSTSTYPTVALYVPKPATPTKEVIRGDLSNGKWGTLCPKQTVENVDGATFYQISYLEEQGGLPYNVVFDQIEGTTLTAGQPYFFIAEGKEIRGNKTGNAETSGSHVNGFYGYISSTDASMELTNWHENYEGTEDYNTFVIHNNSVFRINQGGTMLKSERCYININSTEPSRTAKSSIPGRRRISMSVQNTNVATGVDAINASETPMKLMIDGQLFILRGEKMYDATGRLVK